MIQTLVRDFEWIHLGIGLFGNFCFVVGSVLFFKSFEAWYTLAVWLFVVGSTGMFVPARRCLIWSAVRWLDISS